MGIVVVVVLAGPRLTVVVGADSLRELAHPTVSRESASNAQAQRTFRSDARTGDLMFAPRYPDAASPLRTIDASEPREVFEARLESGLGQAARAQTRLGYGFYAPTRVQLEITHRGCDRRPTAIVEHDEPAGPHDLA